MVEVIIELVDHQQQVIAIKAAVFATKMVEESKQVMNQ